MDKILPKWSSITNLVNFTPVVSTTLEAKIISLSNDINVLQAELKDEGIRIDATNICIVGVQSSGKTTVGCNIMNKDFLFADADIGTRAPQIIELCNSPDNKAVFGEYEHGKLVPSKVISISSPDLTVKENEEIKAEFIHQTNLKAGSNGNVTDKPINLRIYAPDVPNLTLIDLPGLISFADTNKGQDADLDQKIKKIVAKYISNPKTIILVVLAARPDVNSDFGLGFVKQFDPTGERTLVAMTKTDLCPVSLKNFLTQNNIAQKTKYGYFLLRNRTNEEMKTLTLAQGITEEAKFFANHEVYKNCSDLERSRLGVLNLRKSLTNILISSTKELVPVLKEQLDEYEKKYVQLVNELGSPLPNTPSERYARLQVTLSNISHSILQSLKNNSDLNDSIYSDINTIFDKYRKEISELNPFDSTTYSDEYIGKIIKNSDGLDMESPAPSSSAVSFCLRDEKKGAINVLIKPSLNCLNAVNLKIREVMMKILDSERYKRFPKLALQIKNYLDKILLSEYNTLASARIVEDIKSIARVIHTNNEEYHKTWYLIVDPKKKNSKGEIVRSLLITYYKYIIGILQTTVPNKITYYLLDNIVNSLSERLISEFCKLENENLLEESSEIEQKRQKVSGILSKIIEVKQKINSL
jgi:hypothetical protein